MTRSVAGTRAVRLMILYIYVEHLIYSIARWSIVDVALD